MGKQEEFTQNRQLLIQSVVDTIALALVNLKLRETLQLQSIRDPITDLYNRRFMENRLPRAGTGGRNQSPLGIIMFDIDHFKLFNDKFGHQAGDYVLSELGKLLQRVFRKGDIVCRYGGEEFLLILPGAPLEQTIQCANKLQQEIREMYLNYNKMNLGSITISQGVAVYPPMGPPWIISSGRRMLRSIQPRKRDATVSVFQTVLPTWLPDGGQPG